MLCFHCMDKCKYGQLYPFFRFCIPHSTDVTVVYRTTRRRLPRFTVSLYIWHYVEINMLYRNRNLFFFCCCCFFFFAQFFCTVPMEWRGTHALSLTYKLHNFKCHAVSSLNEKCFYLWSLSHIIVSHAACFLHQKCSCPLCLFHFKDIAA